MTQPSPRDTAAQSSPAHPPRSPLSPFAVFVALAMATAPAHAFTASHAAAVHVAAVSSHAVAHAVAAVLSPAVAVASLFVIPAGNLLLLCVVAFAVTSIRRIRPSTPRLLAPFLLLALFPLPATAATRKKPAKPTPKSAHQATSHPAAPHAKPSPTKPSHAGPSHANPGRAKPGKAKPQPRHGSRLPSHSAPAYVAPDNAIAATESTRTQLAEAPVSPFYNPQALAPFFRALSAQQANLAGPNAQSDSNSQTPGSATVRVLQFGDSHTAADLFTGDLRAQLQSRFGNGGLGFQFPGHPFPGYHLAGSSRSQTSGWLTEGNKFTQLGDGDLGLGGISISTDRPGESISLSTTCATLQVHFLRQPEGGHLRLTDNGAFISDIDTAAPPALSNDSGYPTGPNPSSSARGPGTLTYACTPGDHTFELTTLDRAPVRLLGLVTESPGITYECLGINGAVAPLMLRWNQSLFAEYLRQRAPALIVLAYGTNEAAQSPGSNEDYVFQFHRLLQNLHRIVPAAAILVLGPYDRAMKAGRGRRAAWHTFGGTDRIIADQKQACHLYNCAFYDERTRMGGPGAMLRWVSAGLAQGDRTHLTGPGYRALAEALFRDLIAAYTTFQQTSIALARNPQPPTHPATPPQARSWAPLLPRSLFSAELQSIPACQAPKLLNPFIPKQIDLA